MTQKIRFLMHKFISLLLSFFNQNIQEQASSKFQVDSILIDRIDDILAGNFNPNFQDNISLGSNALKYLIVSQEKTNSE